MAEKDGWTDRSRTDRVCEFLTWLCFIDGWEDERDDLLWGRFRASDLYKSMMSNLVSIGVEILVIGLRNIGGLAH
ncbi:hypothetical protein N7478_012292 [Penicillium angulare]|uniref:uncharacterized protein n=1 Tax=Penicillium angulare TaxID=116970 RepID=UPI002540D323|nr:uncharacterized protein N7478_012292 [Penicillium angulare]KAJ5259311.1 hypothetical protein N7478_012292 [Penicillium angulare]